MKEERGLSMKKIIKLSLVLSMLFSLAACSENPDKVQIKDFTEQTTTQLNGLVKALNSARLTNASILISYAEKFKKMKPEFTPLAENLSLLASSHSPVIEDYRKRLKVVRNSPESLGDDKTVIKELHALGWATRKDMYDDSLLDPINTLADLSDGALPRINTPRKTDDEKPASQMVGNPQYGQWQTNSGGQSFWAWYGQYALISSLLGGNRYAYNDWHYNRGWSHYNDYGRERVSTTRQRSKYSQTIKKNEPALKQYGKNRGRTQSSYGTRSNPSHTSTVKSRAVKAARYKSSYGGGASGSSNGRYKSSFGGSSSSSNSRYSSSYAGSSRSSSRSSRSRFGGK